MLTELNPFNVTVKDLISSENLVTKVSINEMDFSTEKPMFIVVGTQDFNGVESFEITNTTKPALKESIKDNKFIDCKYNNMKAIYNAKTKVCKVVFEGLLYVA